jgi:hypothetical protein
VSETAYYPDHEEPGQERDASVVESELGALDCALKELDDRIRALDGRLAPVLRPVGPEVAKDGSNTVALAQPLRSTITTRISDSSATVRRYTARIERILHHLEV